MGASKGLAVSAVAKVKGKAPAMSVSEMLAESMRLHMSTRPVSKQKREWETVAPMLRKAWELRQHAHDADPEHADPAWTYEQKHTPNGTDTHEAMMAFYRDCGVAD